jgi:hypothetical protein
MNKKILYPLAFVSLLAMLGGYFFFYSKGKPTAPAIQLTRVTENKIQDKTDFYSLEATYPSDPRDTNKEIEKFVTQLVNQKKEDWKTGGETWQGEQDIQKEFPDRPKMEYSLMISYTSTSSPRLGTVSYTLAAYEFSGGAHGNTDIYTYTFTDDGKMLASDSLLKLAENNNDITLSRLMADKLRVSLGEYGDTEMLTNGLGLAYLKADGKTLDLEKCSCDGFFFGSNFIHFTVTDTGIIFTMALYQVAPYAAGMPEVFFSWEELTPYLSDYTKQKLAQ